MRDNSGELHPVTEEGTRLHNKLEVVDFADVDYRNMNDDQISLLDMCIGYCKELPTYGNVTVVEPKLEVMAEVYGYADRLQFSLCETEVDMIDWKFGYNKVDDAESNLQGRAYTIGVFHAYPKVQKVNVHFVQPRIGVISVGQFSREQMPDLLQEVRSVVAAANSPEAVKNAFPNAKNCLYCARVDCPKIAEMGFEVAKGYAIEKTTVQALSGDEPDPELLEIPSQFQGSAISDPNTMSKALTLAPIIEKWAAGVRKAATEMRLSQGIEIPGYELKHRSGSRKVTNAQAAWNVVKDQVTAEEFANCATVSMPKLETAFAARAARGKKKMAKQALADRLEDCDALSRGGEVPYLQRIKNK